MRNHNWHYLLGATHRSLTQITDQILHPETVASGLHDMETHAFSRTYYNIPSVTSEQWRITPAHIFKFSDGAAAGRPGAVSPPDATHVILTCHLCQLHFNTLGRIWAEKQQSSWQTASSDPTFTTNLPVKGCDTPAKYWADRFVVYTVAVGSDVVVLQDNTSTDWPLYSGSEQLWEMY